MRLNFTIKQMLIGLMVLSILVVLALALTGWYSNNKLLNTQNQLTEMVLPFEKANQEVRSILIAFIVRQGQIINAQTLKELTHLEERQYLEQGFEEEWKQMKQLASQMGQADQEIDQLTTVYEKLLVKDVTILELVRNRLLLAQKISDQMATINKIGHQLQINAEAISGKINFANLRQQIAARKDLNKATKISKLSQSVKKLIQEDLTKTQRICNELRIAMSALIANGYQLLLVKKLENIDDIKANQIAQATRLIKGALEILKEEVASSRELQVLVEQIEVDFIQLRSMLVEAEDSLATLKTQWLVAQNNIAQLKHSLQKDTEEIENNLNKLKLLSQNVYQVSEHEAIKAKTMAERILLVVGIIAVLCIGIVNYLIGKRIIIPIQKAVSFVHTIATGNLTAQIQLRRRDEISHLTSELSRMAESLSALIGQVQRSGIQVTSSATELAATAKQQKATMLNQVNFTNQVEKSVREISKVAVELVSTMQQIAFQSAETAEFATHGQTNLQRMEESMHSMEQASQSISNRLNAINDKTENITGVVITITKVAEQTNLLSLNAAIEAEKAGEYGRGFNVVAREIRRLADQTAVATLDIEKMVKEMQSAVSTGVMEMDKFITEVQQSTEDVGQTSAQLNRIIEQIQALLPHFEEVNMAMENQSQHAQQINRAMTEVSEGMQQTADSLEESFSAIEQLNEAAKHLQDEVARFKIKGEWSKGHCPIPNSH